MTDYFTRLARTLVGVGPAIRPLLTSPADSVAAGFTPETENRLAERVPDTEVNHRARTAAAHATKPAETPDPEFSPPAKAEALAETPPAVTRNVLSPAPPTLRDEPASETHLAEHVRARAEISSPEGPFFAERPKPASDPSSELFSPASELFDEPPQVKPARSSAVEVESRLSDGVVSAAPATRPSARPVASFNESNDRDPVFERAIIPAASGEDKSAPLAAEQRVIARPLIASYDETQTLAADNLNRNLPLAFTLPDDSLAKAAPVVRVTIGRIEVRAITPEPPKRQRPAPAPPKLSLDEFLRQHNRRQP